MKKEHKDLLIADLCGRLPYKVMVEFVSYKDEEKPWIGELSCKDLDCFMHDVGFIEIKPYLFPLSSMTEEQDKEFALLQTSAGKEGFLYAWNCATMMKWLIENNFDYNGLIPKGLAKDATGKNIY